MTESQITIDELLETIEWLHEESGQESYTESEMTALVLEAVRCTRDWNCFSCSENTLELDEYYAVQPDLWRRYGVEGMLCIGCLEIRLGRKLTPADFIDAEINRDSFDRKSERLRDRLGLGGHQYALAIVASA